MYNSNNAPTRDKIRNSGAIPFATQIPNDSTVAGDHVSDAIDGIDTRVTVLEGYGSDPFFYAGDISLPADFPATPQKGEAYIVKADVIDNDATKTNTGQHALTGSVIWWDGVSAWVDNDPEETGVVVVAATPYTVADGVHTVVVNTATIAAPSVVNLPTALAQRVGRVVRVIDGESGAATYPISVTPQGADEIDNVNAAYEIAANDGRAQVTCAAVGKWYSGPDADIVERLNAIGAGRSQADSRQLAAASETLRVFRALAAGTIIAASAEDGTVAAAGESMTLDVQIGGVTCLTGVITLDDSVAIDTPVAGAIDTAANTFAAGDLITVVRTYVAGGAATPMRDTVCDVQIQYA